MPGCLGLDALWQLLVSSWAGWARRAGAGRSASARSSSPAWYASVKKVEYVVNLKRVILRKLNLGVADGF